MPKTRYYLNQPPLAKNGDLREQLNETQKAFDDLKRELNVVLQRISTRFNDIEGIGTSKPPAPRSLTIDGRQGAFHPRWEKVAGVTGYILTISTNSDGTGVTHRIPIHDPEAQTYPVPWGNVASTRYFIIYSVRGGVVSNPSNIATGLSVSFGAGETAPTAPSLPSSPPSETGPTFDRFGVQQELVESS